MWRSRQYGNLIISYADMQSNEKLRTLTLWHSASNVGMLYICEITPSVLPKPNNDTVKYGLHADQIP